MLIIGVPKAGEGTRTEVVIIDTPKHLLVACCETDHARLTNYCLMRTSNVNGTRPDTYARINFMDSHYYGQLLDNRVISTLNSTVTLYRVQYNVGCSQTRDRKPRYSKERIMNERLCHTRPDR